MYYIQESDKLSFLIKLFNIIKLEGNKIILPITREKNGENKTNEKTLIKLASKTKRILDSTNSNKVVVSKKIKEQEDYITMLNKYNIDIVDGKWLFEALIYEVLEYIIKLKNIKKQEVQISILTNDVTEYVIENIKILSKEYKKINIVTNHIEKFKNIEEQIYEEDGIMITVTNNKKKSLAKSEIILNIDFPKELLNKYQIYENAIIINIKGNMKINKKRFNGLNIIDYEITFKNDRYTLEDAEKFYIKDLYEAEFYKKQNFKNVKNKLKKDNVKIKYLLGNNGIIS